MTPEGNPMLREGFVVLAAVAGAITALAFQKWQNMSRGEIFFTLATGFFFAIFVTPWIAGELLGVPPSNIRALCGLTYVFGSGSNMLLPICWEWARRILGRGEAK